MGGLDVLRTAVLCGGEGQAIVNDGGEDQNRKGEGNGSENAVFHGVVWLSVTQIAPGRPMVTRLQAKTSLKNGLSQFLMPSQAVALMCYAPTRWTMTPGSGCS